MGPRTAWAGDCPGNPDALGVSRTIVVDPREHIRIGSMSYDETLPLADHEVVLTFDDGPLPPYTDRVLEILAHECIKATYFMVGSMARAYPDRVRKVYEAGHTIGTHSMTHPIPFGRLGFERTKAQIDDGIKATQAALGEERRLAPFFRFPGFARTENAEDYLAEQGLMAWGADFPADDWKRISSREIEKRAIRRIEAMGRGVLLLHDIHERTVEALPGILKALKERGYHIVHVVPATADLSKTVTAEAAWRVREPRRLPLPTLALADVQDMSGLFVTDKSADELCALQRPHREPRQAKHHDHHHRVSDVRRHHHHRALFHEARRNRRTQETKVAGIGAFGFLGRASQRVKTNGAKAALRARGRHSSAKSGKTEKVAGTKLALPDFHAAR